MLRGFYNAAQSMINAQRELDSISNNVTNINTPGYKKEHLERNTFMEELILVRGRRDVSGTFRQTYIERNKVNLEQSNFEWTNSRFDVGIYGNVYFNIRTMTEVSNVYQTRNGQFELDGEGYLCLNKAGRVQGQNGDIYIGADDFIIDVDGSIRRISGEEIDTLLLTYVPIEADVRKISDTLFAYEGEQIQPPPEERFEIIQGAFEKSNVDAVKEMARVMEVQRLYEASSQMLKYMDTMNGRSINIAKAGNG